MLFQNSALQDLCYNYTTPLLLMLLGAWFLGVLLSWFWYSNKGKALESETFNLRAELDNTQFKLTGKQAELNDLTFAKQKLDAEHAELRGDYNKLHVQLQKSEKNQKAEPVLQKIEIRPDPEPVPIKDPEEEEEIIPAEHVQEIETREPADAYQETEEVEEIETLDFEEISNDQQVADDQEEDPFENIFADETEDESKTDEEDIHSYANTDLPIISGDNFAIPVRDKLYFNKVYTSFTMIPINELKAVKGIGKKMEKMLHENKIYNLEQLSHTPVDDLKNMIAIKGEKSEEHDPSSWPDQASLILNGNWNELIQFQKIIERGEKDYIEGQPIKVERILSKTLGFNAEFTDLKVVEGIGPKIETLLKEAGYLNWIHLAKAEPSDLNKLLEAAGKPYQEHDPRNWPIQAKMALANNWKGLKKYYS